MDTYVANISEMMTQLAKEEDIMAIFASLPEDISIYAHLRCAKEIKGFAGVGFVNQTLLPPLLNYDANEKIDDELKEAGR